MRRGPYLKFFFQASTKYPGNMTGPLSTMSQPLPTVSEVKDYKSKMWSSMFTKIMFHDGNISEVSVIFRHHRLNCFLNAGHLPPPLSQSLTGWGTEGLGSMVILRSLQATASKNCIACKELKLLLPKAFSLP